MPQLRRPWQLRGEAIDSACVVKARPPAHPLLHRRVGERPCHSGDDEPESGRTTRDGAVSTGGGKAIDGARDLYLRHDIDRAGLNEAHVLIVTGGKGSTLTGPDHDPFEDRRNPGRLLDEGVRDIVHVDRMQDAVTEDARTEAESDRDDRRIRHGGPPLLQRAPPVGAVTGARVRCESLQIVRGTRGEPDDVAVDRFSDQGAIDETDVDGRR